MSTRPLFSILHPSARPDAWRKVYDDWMGKCVDPSQVEYVLCADERWGFDGRSPKIQGHVPFENLRMVWNTGRRCYVDAVATAAKAATGQILIVIADDQFACDGWDEELKSVLALRSMRSPRNEMSNSPEFVVEVSTGTPDEHDRGIFVMPIVSRARYERLGYLFYPEYESMYADNDLCSHARQDGVVIDARHLIFPHKHFLFTPGVQEDEAYRAQNRRQAYIAGDFILGCRHRAGFKTRAEAPLYFPFSRSLDGFDTHCEVTVQSPVIPQVLAQGAQGEGSLYLSLLHQVLTRSLFIDDPQDWHDRKIGMTHPIYKDDGPAMNAETMIGDVRLKNIQDLAKVLIAQGVEGDFMECGVWRGGASIFMRAILKEWGWFGRSVWVADSFAGLPAPNPTEYPVDAGDKHHTMDFLAVPLDEVKANFARYGLLDDQVKFLPGFFKDTLPGPVEKLALLRIDADMYEGVTQALEAMYPKVSEGGYVIIDDYYNLPATRKAVDDFAARHGLELNLTAVDWCAAYWKKNTSVQSTGRRRDSNKGAQGVKVVHLILPGQTFSQSWVRNLTMIMAGLNNKGYACVPHFGYTSSPSITRNGLTQQVLSVHPCDFIVWVDDDNLVDHEQVLKLIHELETHSEADIVCGWTWIQPDVAIIEPRASCGVFNESGTIKPIASFKIEGEAELYEVEWTGFPLVAMRRETLVKAGKNPFHPMPTRDPEIGYYGEDVAFSLRLRQNGGRIFVDPTVYVPHLKLREAIPVQSPEIDQEQRISAQGVAM